MPARLSPRPGGDREQTALPAGHRARPFDEVFSILTSFDALGLSDRLVSRLKSLGITTPTPIQEQAIPQAMAGRDVMGLAQTGTGKTAAFGLPLVHQLLKIGKKPAPKTVRALILAPTRELAKQIADNLSGFVQKTPLKIALAIGGVSLHAQSQRLHRGADILVATPGRLLDLTDRRAVRLDQTHFLVLDEADQMLDLGFIVPLRKIADMLPNERQTMLFSATMPKQMADLAATYLTDPVRVAVAPPGKVADKIAQSVHFVPQSEKTALLKDYLASHRGDRSLVFARTKHGAERLMKQLTAADFSAASIHGNKTQGQRQRALQAFRDNKIQVLVATDVAARGLDIPDVGFVFNYDLPNVPENYVHRIGRTARAGAEGQAIAFCSAEEMADLRTIERTTKLRIDVAGGEPWAAEQAKPKPKRRSGRGRGKPGSGPNGQRRRSGKRPSKGPRLAA